MTNFLDFLKVSDGLNRNYLADGNHDIDKLAAAAYGRTYILFPISIMFLEDASVTTNTDVEPPRKQHHPSHTKATGRAGDI